MRFGALAATASSWHKVAITVVLSSLQDRAIELKALIRGEKLSAKRSLAPAVSSLKS